MRIAVYVLITILFLGCVQQETGGTQQYEATLVLEDNTTVENQTLAEQPAPEPEITLLSVSTDKPTYGSRETVTVLVRALVVGDIPGVTMNVNGVHTTRGIDLLQQNELMHLRDGNNTANFTLELPYCSSCSGMPPGVYYIYAGAVRDNQTVAQANCSFNFSY